MDENPDRSYLGDFIVSTLDCCMQGPPVSEARKLVLPSGEASTQIETSLRVSAAVFALGALYSDLLKKMVLKNPQTGYDRKELTKFSRILLDDEAHYILLVIWRESPFVTDECLRRMNLTRGFADGPMTAWGLATKIASAAAERAKTNSRIRSIGLAAAAFGLVERCNLRSTSKPLVGTERLHRFILELSEQQLKIFSELNTFMVPDDVGSDVPQQ